MKKDKDLPLFFQLLWKTAVICVPIEICGIIWAENVTGWTLGVLWGLLNDIIRLILMQRSVGKAVKMDPGNAESYTRLQYMLRYFLTGGMLIAAAVTEFISPISTILAIAALQLATYIQGWLDAKYNPADEASFTEIPFEEKEDEDKFEKLLEKTAAARRINANFEKLGRQENEVFENQTGLEGMEELPVKKEEETAENEINGTDEVFESQLKLDKDGGIA